MLNGAQFDDNLAYRDLEAGKALLDFAQLFLTNTNLTVVQMEGAARLALSKAGAL